MPEGLAKSRIGMFLRSLVAGIVNACLPTVDMCWMQLRGSASQEWHSENNRNPMALSKGLRWPSR